MPGMSIPPSDGADQPENITIAVAAIAAQAAPPRDADAEVNMSYSTFR